jgi:hypothetical protein
MDITIKLSFDSSFTPKASRMTVEEIKDAIEDAMQQSNFLDKISNRIGEKSRHDIPAWDFAGR